MYKTQNRTPIGEKDDFKPVNKLVRKRLHHLFNYSDELRRRGFSNQQIAIISARDAELIIKNNIPPFYNNRFKKDEKSTAEILLPIFYLLWGFLFVLYSAWSY